MRRTSVGPMSIRDLLQINVKTPNSNRAVAPLIHKPSSNGSERYVISMVDLPALTGTALKSPFANSSGTSSPLMLALQPAR